MTFATNYSSTDLTTILFTGHVFVSQYNVRQVSAPITSRSHPVVSDSLHEESETVGEYFACVKHAVRHDLGVRHHVT